MIATLIIVFVLGMLLGARMGRARAEWGRVWHEIKRIISGRSNYRRS